VFVLLFTTRTPQPCVADHSYLTILCVAVFTGKDASRALAKSSLKAEDCVPEWEDLDEKEKTTLEQWFVFFSKRYNIVGKVAKEAPNL
jgi:hypothetical protein